MARDNLSLYEREERERDVSILGIPFEYGSDVRGFAAAPRYLISCGLEEALRASGARIASMTSVPTPKAVAVEVAGRAKHMREVNAASRRAYRDVTSALTSGNTVVALGGDHAAAFGTLQAAAASLSSLGVIYIDAHPDVHTVETTISGNMHGMVAAAAMGFGVPRYTDARVLPRDFLFIGLKDFDDAEVDFLREQKCPSFTMLDIERRGLSAIFHAIDALAQRSEHIWISMDLDSVDRQYAPGVGMSNDGGLTRREVTLLARYIGKRCNVRGFDLVEVLPERDQENKTGRLAVELAALFLGGEHSWYSAYIDGYEEFNIDHAAKETL